MAVRVVAFVIVRRMLGLVGLGPTPDAKDVEFGGDGECGLDRQWGEGVDEQRADGGVDASAGDALAVGAAVLDLVVLADVGGQFRGVVAEVVAHGHASSASAADDDALQQSGSFAGRAGFAVGSVRGGAFGESGLVGVEGGEGDVAGVGGGDEGDLLVAGGDRPGAGLLVGAEDLAVPAEAEHAGVAGVVQDAQHGGVGQRRPVQFSFVGSLAVAAGKEQPSVVECLEYRVRGSGGVEGDEQVGDGLLDGSVGVEHYFAERVVGQADGQWGDQLSAAGLVQDAAA